MWVQGWGFLWEPGVRRSAGRAGRHGSGGAAGAGSDRGVPPEPIDSQQTEPGYHPDPDLRPGGEGNGKETGTELVLTSYATVSIRRR